MSIIGKVSARTIIYIGVAHTAGVILLCYAIAVGLGHRKPWLPTISNCGDHPPEEYIFRWGMMVSSSVPLLQAVVMRAAGRISKVTFSLGFLAGLCLSGVAVVQDNENNTVHTTFAVIFFLCEDIKNFFLLMDDHHRMSQTSVGALMFTNIVSCAATIARLAVVFIGVASNAFPFLAVFEWANTAAILICHAIVASGMGSLYIGEIKEDVHQTKKKGPV